MKITIYDLLGLVKDGKIPKKIKYMGYIFEYDTNHKRYESYFDEQIWTLNDFVNVDDNLNDTVKIPYYEEEKKIPEKLDHLIGYDIQQFDDLKEYVEITTNDLFGEINKVIDKLNDVLDYLKSKGE